MSAVKYLEKWAAMDRSDKGPRDCHLRVCRVVKAQWDALAKVEHHSDFRCLLHLRVKRHREESVLEYVKTVLLLMPELNVQRLNFGNGLYVQAMTKPGFTLQDQIRITEALEALARPGDQHGCA